MDLKYAIVGVGGIGGYYGGKLAYNNKDVHFLLHSDYEYVKNFGLRIESIHGNFALPTPQIYQNADEMPPSDVIFVCLKTTQNNQLKKILQPITHKDSLVILIQNGLGIEEDLQIEFPSLSIAGGLAFIGSSKVGPGHIHHQDQGALNIGSYSVKDKNRLIQVIADLKESGIAAHEIDLKVARWKKLVWNIPYNGLSVVLDAKTDRLTSNPYSRELLKRMMHEVIEASRQMELSEEIPESFAEFMIATTEKMSAYAPSMKLDYDFNRALEIDYIYTRPLIEAQKRGIQMPTVATIEQQLRFITTSQKN